MEMLIWAGTGFSLIGLIGLIWSILKVVRARKRISDDEALRDEVRKVIPFNMGSLFVSILGLMMVILGIFLS